MAGRGRPTKRLKFTITRDFELESEAVVRHVATTSSGSVLSHSDHIGVPPTPDKDSRTKDMSTPMPPIPAPDFDEDIPDDHNGLGVVHYLSAPAPRKRYENTVSYLSSMTYPY
jgi:hypothetical protein